MSQGLTCQRCGGTMEVGFFVDSGYPHKLQQRWSPGEPKESWLSGEVSTNQFRTSIRVTTFRCERCGKLESYAVADSPEQ